MFKDSCWISIFELTVTLLFLAIRKNFHSKAPNLNAILPPPPAIFTPVEIDLNGCAGWLFWSARVWFKIDGESDLWEWQQLWSEIESTFFPLSS